MARVPRQAPGGFVYHVLNRAVARLPLFEKPADYAAFLRVLTEALAQYPMRILAFVSMPNHWHFLLWPERDNDLSNFCRPSGAEPHPPTAEPTQESLASGATLSVLKKRAASSFLLANRFLFRLHVPFSNRGLILSFSPPGSRSASRKNYDHLFR